MGKEKICVDQSTLSERIIMRIFTQGRRDNTYGTFILFFIRGYGDNLKEIRKENISKKFQSKRKQSEENLKVCFRQVHVKFAGTNFHVHVRAGNVNCVSVLMELIS